MTLWYGTHQSLEWLRGKLAETIAIDFEPHESSYKGGDYYLHRGSDFTFKIFHNADIYDGDPVFVLDDYFPTVLLVESAKPLRPDIVAKLGGISELTQTFESWNPPAIS